VIGKEWQVTARPHVLLAVAMSIDGYIDDMRHARLMLSNEEDFDRVDDVRSSVDAILMGANTIRRDNPRLLVRSAERQRERVQRGVAAHPMKVTLTGRGDLDVAARFFTAGDNEKLVYARDPAAPALREAFGHVATVVGAGEPIDLGVVLDDLAERKVERAGDRIPGPPGSDRTAAPRHRRRSRQVYHRPLTGQSTPGRQAPRRRTHLHLQRPTRPEMASAVRDRRH